ncbi:MAG: TIGR01777 family protein [Candidatus Aminicenantes bacterium]|nr:TIGR01777 family protein [Candidatus Aminicenantes bacterium]
MARIIVTGATGFIGKALCFRLLEENYEVVALSRSKKKGEKIFGADATVVEWDGKSSGIWQDYANGAYAVVNLAGENIGSGRWTPKKKQSILQSRLDAGRAVVEALKSVDNKPEVVIQASAIGYYGSREDEIIDESSSSGKGFLADVVKKWELSTQEIETQDIRRVIIRSGIVLGREGGAFFRLIKPFRLFVGGRLGSGKQWFSWIHLEDELKAILFLMEREDLHGVFNLTAPHQMKQKDFARILGRIMKRPSWLPVPSFVLRMYLGEMAEETLLSGQRVKPKRLLEAGYRFLYPETETTLKEILSKNS